MWANGCIERFFRTLKEQLLWVRRFADLEELRTALFEFRDRYTTIGLSNVWNIGRGPRPAATLNLNWEP